MSPEGDRTLHPFSTVTQTSYLGHPLVPGEIVQTEDFGGEGVSYHDSINTSTTSTAR